MNIIFSLNLPKDESSVPVVRRISREALSSLGIEDDCISEIEVALSEACTNVLKHVEGTEEAYEVKVEVNEQLCEIRVIDTGTGFDHESEGLSHADHSAEGGRGIFLMRAMVDQIEFTSAPESGTVVRLTKKLELKDSSVLSKLVAPAVST